MSTLILSYLYSILRSHGCSHVGSKYRANANPDESADLLSFIFTHALSDCHPNNTNLRSNRHCRSNSQSHESPNPNSNQQPNQQPISKSNEDTNSNSYFQP